MKSHRLLLHALIATFAILTTTFMLGDYGRAMIASQQKTLLGGDIRIRSPEPFKPALNAARVTSLKQTTWVTLNTMISANGNFVLVTMKAVDTSYPLYGEVHIDTGSGEPQQRRGAPPKDGIWLGQRLKIQLGDQVSLANQSYRVDAWLLETPDLVGGFQSFFPLVLVNFASIDQMLLTRPGARPYFFRAYAAPNDAIADQLISTIERLKDPLLQIQRTYGENNRTNRIVDNVFQFISMFLTLGVAFAVLALSLASQDYALRAERQIALLKALGASRRRAMTRLIQTWPSKAVKFEFAQICSRRRSHFRCRNHPIFMANQPCSHLVDLTCTRQPNTTRPDNVHWLGCGCRWWVHLAHDKVRLPRGAMARRSFVVGTSLGSHLSYAQHPFG